MADQVMNYQCPACAAPLRFDGATGMLVCDYCDSKFDVATVEAMKKEEEEKAAQAMKEQAAESWDTDGMTEDWGGDAASLKSYQCPSCGAELICEQSTAATCCPYCGNQTVIPGQFSGALKPEYLIPFKTDKNAAIAALKEHYKGKKLLPKSFVEDNHIDDIQGVYVPFWMFDAVADGEMHFRATKSTTTKNGNIETTTTKHYDVDRVGKLAFQKVPVDASTRMPDLHMDSIEPFDYADLKPFSAAYLPGFLADKYDVEMEECGKRMEERCISTFEADVKQTVQGYDEEKVTSKNIIVRKGNVDYALMPVWLLATQWENQNFLFAMNGQTGKMVGDLPVDKKKYWSFFGGYSAGLIALMFLIFNVLMGKPLHGAGLVILGILIPVFIAFIIVSAMKGKLSSVFHQNAGKYKDSKGLVLSQKTDTLVKTTTSQKRIENKS